MLQKEQNNSTVKQRILQFVNDSGMSHREFYSKSGVSRGTLTNKTGISEKTLAKIFATFPSLDRNWVIYGKIAPISAPISAPIQEGIEYKENQETNIVDEENNTTLYKIISRQMLQILVKETRELSAENAILKYKNEQLTAENEQLRKKIDQS